MFNTVGSLSDKWFHNLTNIEIPPQIVNFVSLGPKFTQKCIMDKSLAIESIKNVEYFLNSHEFPSDIKTNIRCSVIEETKSALTRTEHISKENRLFSKTLGLIKQFCNDKKILFTHANKGSSTVAMNVIDYENKMLLLLADESNYKVLESNPLKKLQNETKIFLQSWN